MNIEKITSMLNALVCPDITGVILDMLDPYNVRANLEECVHDIEYISYPRLHGVWRDDMQYTYPRSSNIKYNFPGWVIEEYDRE
jgi:hypothetical protein